MSLILTTDIYCFINRQNAKGSGLKNHKYIFLAYKKLKQYPVLLIYIFFMACFLEALDALDKLIIKGE